MDTNPILPIVDPVQPVVGDEPADGTAFAAALSQRVKGHDGQDGPHDEADAQAGADTRDGMGAAELAAAWLGTMQRRLFGGASSADLTSSGEDPPSVEETHGDPMAASATAVVPSVDPDASVAGGTPVSDPAIASGAVAGSAGPGADGSSLGDAVAVTPVTVGQAHAPQPDPAEAGPADAGPADADPPRTGDAINTVTAKGGTAETGTEEGDTTAALDDGSYEANAAPVDGGRVGRRPVGHGPVGRAPTDDEPRHDEPVDASGTHRPSTSEAATTVAGRRSQVSDGPPTGPTSPGPTVGADTGMTDRASSAPADVPPIPSDRTGASTDVGADRSRGLDPAMTTDPEEPPRTGAGTPVPDTGHARTPGTSAPGPEAGPTVGGRRATLHHVPLSVVERIERAARELEHAPPPRSVVIQLAELDAAVRVTLRGDRLHLAPTTPGPAPSWLADAERALEAGGFTLAERDGRGQDRRNDDEAASTRPGRRRTSVTAADDHDLRL